MGGVLVKVLRAHVVVLAGDHQAEPGDRELAEKLQAMGVHETERNIANKISRGGFTAVFLVQVLEAIGVHEIRV